MRAIGRLVRPFPSYGHEAKANLNHFGKVFPPDVLLPCRHRSDMALEQRHRSPQPAANLTKARGVMSRSQPISIVPRYRTLLAACMAVLAGGATIATAMGRDDARQHLASLVAAPLETRFARASIGDPASLKGLVVLGGGRERLREAGRLARRWPHLQVFVSGAGSRQYVLGVLGEGIDPARVSVEEFSRNTRDNARNSRRLVAPVPGERWLLVTSAVHMPRSLAAFRRYGFAVEPWPVYDFAASGKHALDAAAHEWVGIAWYWLRYRGERLAPTVRAWKANAGITRKPVTGPRGPGRISAAVPAVPRA